MYGASYVYGQTKIYFEPSFWTIYIISGVKQAKYSMRIVIRMGRLIHKLQKERDMTILYIGKLGPGTKTFLMRNYEETDDAFSVSYDESLCTRKPTIWVPTRSDTNQPVQSQKMVEGLKFCI